MRRLSDSLYTRLALVLVLALLTGFATMALLFRSHIDDSRQQGFVRGLANEIRLIDELRHRFPAADLKAIRGVELASFPLGVTRLPEGDLAELHEHLVKALGRKVELHEAIDTDHKGFWVKLEGEPVESQWLFIPNIFERRNKLFARPDVFRSGPPTGKEFDRPGNIERSVPFGAKPPEDGEFKPRDEARPDHPHQPDGRSDRPAQRLTHDEMPARFGPPVVLPPPPGALPPLVGIVPFDWRWIGFWAGFAVVLLGSMFLLWQVQIPMRRLIEAMQKVGLTRQPQELTLRGPTEIQSVVKHFNQMVQRLRRSSQERNIMLAGIAHDLRSPLTRLRLQLELELESNPRYEAIVRNFESIDIIIDQFLLFARGGEVEALEERDLALFLHEVAAEYLERGLVVDVPEDLAPVLAIRPGALRRAIHNLIDNAFEYGAAPVCLRAIRLADCVQIQVVDHGEGIDDQQREQALQPFARLDAARSGQAHCGLGLAIVDEVVAGLGGIFELKSADPHGLVAQITLPLH